MKPSAAVAIVPAHNEAPRIATVLKALLGSHVFARVLVVDDGSTDGTADMARQAGAEVLSLCPNRGKGGAMWSGLQVTREPVVAFFDADLKGLRPEHARALVGPVARGERVMVVGLRDHGTLYNTLQRALPPITGERAVRRDALERVHRDDWSGWRVEAGINEAVRRAPWSGPARVEQVLLEGLVNTEKWRKDQSDARAGLCDAVRMLREVVIATAEARARPERVPAEDVAVWPLAQLACLIPAHNEQGRIGEVVRTVRAWGGVTGGLWVVDDGSTDGTAEEARAAGADHVMQLRPNQGKGNALRAAIVARQQRSGAAAARPRWWLLLDADLRGLKTEHLDALAGEAATGAYGMVVGSVRGDSTEDPRWEPWENLIATHGLDLSGQRLVHAQVLARMDCGRLWELGAGYGLETALDAACARAGYAARRIHLLGVANTYQAEKLGSVDAGLRAVVKIYARALQSKAAALTDTLDVPW